MNIHALQFGSKTAATLIILTVISERIGIFISGEYSPPADIAATESIAAILILAFLRREQKSDIQFRLVSAQRDDSQVFPGVLIAYFIPLAPVTVALKSELFVPYTFFIVTVMALCAIADIRVRQEKIKTQAESEDSYLALKPEILLYVSGPRGVYYQINQWIPVLELLSFRIAILIRNLDVLKGMGATKIPVYYIGNGRKLEWALSNGPKVVLYPNNRPGNCETLRYPDLFHVFINHGESDKHVNQSQMLMAYDKLFVGGPLAEQRLKHAGLPIRPDQIVYVGRPQAEMALAYRERQGEIRNILYAPTWEGGVDATAHSSVGPLGLQVLKELASDGRYQVRIKPHPLTGTSKKSAQKALRKLEEISARAGFLFLDAGVDLHEQMNWSDVMICDVSAVLNEYLITGKPIILCNVKGEHISMDEIRSQYPTSRAAYTIKQGESILHVLESINQEDALKEKRAELRYESLGGGGSIERFIAALEDLVAAPSKSVA
jgi:hypothetical protein